MDFKYVGLNGLNCPETFHFIHRFTGFSYYHFVVVIGSLGCKKTSFDFDDTVCVSSLIYNIIMFNFTAF